jgi:hypothetical protein
MHVLQALWLPIVLSAVFVFVVSSVIHMALPWHNNDYRKLPSQDAVMDALRPFALPPGDYMVPRPETMKDMQTPEFKEKMNRGPVMILTVRPNGMWGMGRNLSLWFIYLLVVSFFAGFIAYHARPLGASRNSIVHFSGLAAFLGYVPAIWQMSIWYNRSLATTIKTTIDGVIYAAVTAATFVWLWPR